MVDDVDGADASTLRLLDGLLPLLDDVPVLVALAGRSTPRAWRRTSSYVSVLAEVRVTPLDPDHVARVGGTQRPIWTTPPWPASFGRRPVARVSHRRSHVPAMPTLLGGPRHRPSLGRPRGAGRRSRRRGGSTLAQLAELAGVGPEVVAALESQRVLTTGPHGRPLPSSELWVTAARRSLGVRDRRGTAEPAAAADAPAVVALAARVAARLERFAPAAPGSVTATVWETAGRVDRAGEAWERAADEAAATHAVGTAAAALRRAIELGGDDALLRLGRRAGEWSLAAGDRVDADRLAARLLPRLARADRPAQIGALALRYRARLEAGLGGHDDALDRALEIDAPPCRERVDVLVIDALRRVLDDPVGAGATAAMALADARARRPRVDRPRCRRRRPRAGGRRRRGRRARALRRGAGIRRCTDDPALEARLASNRLRAVACRTAERGGTRRRSNSNGCACGGSRRSVTSSPPGRVGALVTLGRLDEAAAAVSEARGMKMAADPAAHLDLVDAELALARAEVDRAAVLVERRCLAARRPRGVVGERRARRSGRGGSWPSRPGGEGSPRTVCAGAPTVICWRRAAGAVVVACPPLGRRSPRRRIRCRGGTGTGRRRHRSSLEDGNSRELQAIGATIRALRDRDTDAWSAAAARGRAVPAPLEVLRCRLAMAALAGTVAELEAIGDECRRIGAFGLAAEADDAARAAGGRRATPRLPGLLTTREVEVLACVAEGSPTKRSPHACTSACEPSAHTSSGRWRSCTPAPGAPPCTKPAGGVCWSDTS
ncbi:MAG: hypothetical protein R2713_10975 [Ilumatobacteraceae bacterium]